MKQKSLLLDPKVTRNSGEKKIKFKCLTTITNSGEL